MGMSTQDPSPLSNQPAATLTRLASGRSVLTDRT